MVKVIKSKNITKIEKNKVNVKKAEGNQDCIKCTGIHPRATLYVVTSKKGTENIWHPKCFNLHYGKAVKPEGKAEELINKFLSK